MATPLHHRRALIAIGLLALVPAPAGERRPPAGSTAGLLHCAPAVDDARLCPPLTLKRREWVRLTVAPGAPALRLTLRADRAEPIFIDVDTRDLPPSGLAFIAPEGGAYSLQIQASGLGRSDDVVVLAERRPAQPTDDARAAATRAFI